MASPGERAGNNPPASWHGSRPLPAETLYYDVVNVRPVVNTIQTRTPPTSVAVAVVTAVARHANADEMALPPLSEVVDPDALDRLFAGSADGPRGGHVEVGFEYCGVQVVVEGEGTVSIDGTVAIEGAGGTDGVAVSVP